MQTDMYCARVRHMCACARRERERERALKERHRESISTLIMKDTDLNYGRLSWKQVSELCCRIHFNVYHLAGYCAILMEAAIHERRTKVNLF